MMPKTIGSFDFEPSGFGAVVVPTKERLCPECVSDGEVDGQIMLLKQDLDAVAQKMKAAIRKQRSKPLFPKHG
ncbi:hypothetical protein JYU02_01260 [bacterium AH-315-P15]|nr:hypothetical protein [bacterium AH-315-P15]